MGNVFQPLILVGRGRMQGRGAPGMYGEPADFGGQDNYDSDRARGTSYRGDAPARGAGYGRGQDRSGIYQSESRGGRDGYRDGGGRYDDGWSGSRQAGGGDMGRSRRDSDNRSQNGANLPRELSPSGFFYHAFFFVLHYYICQIMFIC